MKDSGIAWIGEIPEGWEVGKLGTLYVQRNEKVSDKDFPPLSVTMKGILPQLETAAKTNDGDNRKLVCKGDFAINSRSDRRGSCGISPYDGSVSLINTILCPRGNMNPNFYNWLFHTSMFADEFYKWGHGIVDDLWTTRWQEMKNISIVLPPLSEQRAIATFLDEKCGEIDELVALQEKMIEELKAYKQAVITETVTKGLDTNVKMKDSGVEWIGQIPSSSEIMKVGYVIGNYKSGPFGSALITNNLLTNGKILIYTPEHINKGRIDIEHNLYLQEERLEEMSQFIVNNGEIVFPIVGSLGKAMVVTESMPKGIINQRLAKFTLRADIIDTNYFMWLFGKSNFYSSYIEINSRGAIIVNLTKQIINNMPIVIHSLPEQRAIATYLDTKCADIDALIFIKQKKIDELKNYKKSLIYEYVTGKKQIC